MKWGELSRVYFCGAKSLIIRGDLSYSMGLVSVRVFTGESCLGRIDLWFEFSRFPFPSVKFRSLTWPWKPVGKATPSSAVDISPRLPLFVTWADPDTYKSVGEKLAYHQK